VDDGGGGGGLPVGGAGRGGPIGALIGSVPLPLTLGRFGGSIDPAGFGRVGAEVFRWGFFASGLGNVEGGTSEGRLEGTTFGGMAESFCKSGLGICWGFAGPVGVFLGLPLAACMATGSVGVGRVGSEVDSLVSGLIFDLSDFSFLILGLGTGRGVSTGAGTNVLVSYCPISTLHSLLVDDQIVLRR
jgi:hypothetical protein